MGNDVGVFYLVHREILECHRWSDRNYPDSVQPGGTTVDRPRELVRVREPTFEVNDVPRSTQPSAVIGRLQIRKLFPARIKAATFPWQATMLEAMPPTTTTTNPGQSPTQSVTARRPAGASLDGGISTWSKTKTPGGVCRPY
jgi:hypothetical protein